MVTLEIASFLLDNKSGKKVRAEVYYNEGSKELRVVLRDKIDTVFVDANPNKVVQIPVNWILETSEGESSSNDGGQNTAG